MAKKALGNMQPRAAQIQNETQESANSAIRVGGLISDIVDSSLFEYDPLVAYKQGQYCIFQGALAQCIVATTPGQSPAVAKTKWSLKLVVDAESIVLGNGLPVSADALARKILTLPAFTGNIPNATPTQRGLARQSTKPEANEGVNDDSFITPLDQRNAFIEYSENDSTDLDTALKRGNVSDEDARIGSLGVNRAPDNPSAPYLATLTVIENVLYLTKMSHRQQSDISYAYIKEKLAAEGLLGGGGGGGSVAFTPEFWEAVYEFVYKRIAYKEGRETVLPDYPTVGGTSPVAAKINANLSKYEPDSIGLTILLNGSNGENFMGQVLGTNGVAAPDQSWHLLSRIDGTYANGTYSLPYYDLPAGGFLAAGAYKARVRIGVDNSTIVERDIVVASNVPVSKGVYRIVGPASIPQNVINAHYVLQEQYTDNSWREVTNLPTVWVILENIPGLGVAGGNVSGGPGIVSADTIFTLVCSIGINIELKVLLTFETGETPPDPVVKIINAVFGRDDDYQGRLALANVNGAVQVMRSTYKLVNGLESLSSQSNWFNADKIDGEYSNGGATVQHVWGFEKPSGEGTYHIYDRWRPANSSDESTYKTLTPYYTVVVGANEPAPNVIEYVQYRFVPNGLGSGNNDLLEIQMRDGYAEQPMFIDVRLASQAPPTQNSNTYLGYYRNLAQYNAGSPVAKSVNRSYQLASGQNLKSKNLKVYITDNYSRILLTLTLNTGTTDTNGFVNIYSPNTQNTEWEYDND